MDTNGWPGGRAIRRIVIVGGGTAGWMAASLLAKKLEKHPVSLTVIESSEIGSVGVGEATVPAIRDFFRAIELDDSEVLRETGGTVKLGIAFRDWLRPGHEFFHPFGLYGTPSRGVPFHQYWLKLRQAGHDLPLGDYSLCSTLAGAGRFALPGEAVSDLSVFDWAVHFDASRFAGLLRRRATTSGVARLDARVVDVRLDGADRIGAVVLASGETVEGDLFIDCSGFRALLLGQALGVGYHDWSDWLPCDKAAAIPCVSGQSAVPYTVSTARSAGWQWRIPLQHRVGNGYVYSSTDISDDEAVATLISNLEGEPLAEPNLIRFTAGRRDRFWSGNCVAVGLAAGFMEPLESTSITLIQTAVERLIDLFPDRDFDPALADEYNRATTLEFERIRDFLILHYHGNQRRGEPFWDRMRKAALPDKLAHKIRLFRARGKLVRFEWEAFLDPSWLSLYAGLDMMPERHDPMADHFSEEDLLGAFARMREAIDRTVSAAAPHQAFLAAISAPSPIGQ